MKPPNSSKELSISELLESYSTAAAEQALWHLYQLYLWMDSRRPPAVLPLRVFPTSPRKPGESTERGSSVVNQNSVKALSRGKLRSMSRARFRYSTTI